MKECDEASHKEDSGIEHVHVEESASEKDVNKRDLSECSRATCGTAEYCVHKYMVEDFYEDESGDTRDWAVKNVHAAKQFSLRSAACLVGAREAHVTCCLHTLCRALGKHCSMEDLFRCGFTAEVFALCDVSILDLVSTAGYAFDTVVRVLHLTWNRLHSLHFHLCLCAQHPTQFPFTPLLQMSDAHLHLLRNYGHLSVYSLWPGISVAQLGAYGVDAVALHAWGMNDVRILLTPVSQGGLSARQWARDMHLHADLLQRLLPTSQMHSLTAEQRTRIANLYTACDPQ